MDHWQYSWKIFQASGQTSNLLDISFIFSGLTNILLARVVFGPLVFQDTAIIACKPSFFGYLGEDLLSQITLLIYV